VNTHHLEVVDDKQGPQANPMNTPPHVQFAISLGVAVYAAMAFAPCHAQSIEQIVDLGPGTTASSVCLDAPPDPTSPGGLFLAASTPSTGRALLSLDLAQDPVQVTGAADTFQLLNRKVIAVAGTLTLIAVGDTMPDANTAWHGRRSVDGGASWQSIDPDWRLVSGKSSSAKGATVDGEGRIFICGRAADSRGRYHPVIRRSADSGVTWTTVLNGSAGANFDNVADIQFVPASGSNPGGIFAVGRVGNRWTVWRSRDGGVTWLVVHSWAPSKNIAEATAVTCDASGNLYVGGMGKPSNRTTRNWYVWASTNGGTTWQDLGTTFPTAADNIVNDILVSENSEELWVVGSSQSFADSVSTISWAMQYWTLSGGWSAPFYLGNPGTVSRASGLAADPATGLIYACGYLADTTGKTHGTVLQIGP
jgi:hypothetical protein